MAAAILVPIGLIVIARMVWPHSNPGARLAAISGVLFAVWLLIAVTNPATAGEVAGGVASGAGGFIHGLGVFIGDL
jgi:hypothetical protein